MVVNAYKVLQHKSSGIKPYMESLTHFGFQ